MTRINVTVPVYNDAQRLLRSLPKLHQFLGQHFAGQFELVVADNGSTDETQSVAADLCGHLSCSRVMRFDARGRGLAVRRAWQGSDCEILSYMDVDLSTDLCEFTKLVVPLMEKRYELAVGSRLLKASRVIRSVKREVISRCYNRLIKLLFRVSFSDAQCGFKAITSPAAAKLLPLVQDNRWFFDTEMLLVAERLHLRIFDLPVRWNENTDSRVKLIPTVFADVVGLARLRLFTSSLEVGS